MNKIIKSARFLAKLEEKIYCKKTCLDCEGKRYPKDNCPICHTGYVEVSEK